MISRSQQVEYFGLSDVGCVREANEDAVGIAADDGLFVVCDGMGGGAAGEVASNLAVESFLAAVREQEFGSSAEAGEISEGLRYAVVDANSLVLQRSRLSVEFRGMGTTLVALWVRRGRIEGKVRRGAWLVHVGDSRCYRLRDEALAPLTVDHSLVEQQVRMGEITAEEAEKSTMRHVITRAVGVDARVEPEMSVAEAQKGDVFLLCSDGLTREVPDARVADLMRKERRLEDACRALINEARLKGGRDNITCLLVRVL
jgi:PPM family protein phosphatase